MVDQPTSLMLNIDPAKISPVPKEDIEKLRKAIFERVVKPYYARRGIRLMPHSLADERAIQPERVARLNRLLA